MSRQLFTGVQTFVDRLYRFKLLSVRQAIGITLALLVMVSQSVPSALAQGAGWQNDARLNRPVLNQSNFTYLGYF